MTASQCVSDPVTHWPCFFLGHSAAVWSPAASKLQSEHSLTPSPPNTPRCVFYTRCAGTSSFTHTHSATCQCCVHVHTSACTLPPRLRMHEYLLLSLALISSQYMNTPKTSPPRRLPPPLLGPCLGLWLVPASRHELPFGKSCLPEKRGRSECVYL